METVLIKIGGKAAERQEALGGLAREMSGLSKDRRFILVHGGGAEVTALSEKLGITSVFKDGVRQTSPREMDVVEMVLAGKVNKQLVRLLRTQGLDAVGLSGSDGGTLAGRTVGTLPNGEDTRTGEVTKVDTKLLELLLGSSYLPVVASPSMDGAGRALNINADAAAFAIASALPCFALVFLSDIPGVMADGAVLPELSSAKASSLVSSGVISGGMVPKVAAALDALGKGVSTVIIGQYEGGDSLARLLDGRQGTRIWK
ncbi:MAG TPA: acetylglutamate kinase [Spirochaetia bacterium]|nr:acetylglutamate kinase [Spirochaetia bacterium]